MPVVVGYDESLASVAAVRWAAEAAPRLGSDLAVVSVSEPADQTTAGASSSYAELRRASRAAAVRGVDLGRSSAPDAVITGVGVVGGPAGELVARSSEAGLVVVGRNSRSALQAAVLGSVSFAVALHARCPVVVVGEAAERQPGPSWPVVVGTDGSRPAMSAVALATEFASRWGAPLQIVSAWRAPALTPWQDPPEGSVMVRASRQAWMSVARAAVDEAVAQVQESAPGLTVTGTVAEGRADDVLTEQSRHAGMVVIGSRGHGGFAGLMVGSVSHGVMRRAASPVVVVRRGAL
ncbi:Nucleotide-binding universal stress protein, UspA family [Pedococcus dokdonensis]|uniref:Nucleotide-binding universal stress protein, UspA family n=1 Tax=Pedococcus dokdonensis TaxID=443156 RepID=A0A1H0NAE9_9MICO|nr:universal stress protein [Pedococcus dokdonensis]SDO89643.1 Nucleotide-binding universal stress protein, UspA family [Pedococcus dokdonensis]